jgi:EAL domain-containing protein (putative c-di-GMP-specific phosphodiesterase class I)
MPPTLRNASASKLCLRHAVKANLVALHYQIKVDIEGRLDRNRSSVALDQSIELGAVLTIYFIPLSEETSLIVELSE